MTDGRRSASAAAAGRTGGNGAAADDVGGTVCGGVIAPVISALSRARRSLALANWLCADLFAASTLAFRPATSSGAGLENPPVIAAPASTPTAAAIATEAASMA